MQLRRRLGKIVGGQCCVQLLLAFMGFLQEYAKGLVQGLVAHQHAHFFYRVAGCFYGVVFLPT